MAYGAVWKGAKDMSETPEVSQRKYDISIIRPELREADFHLRGSDMSKPRLAAIRKGLRTLHTLELMSLPRR